MKVVCLYDDELRALYNLLNTRRTAIMHYAREEEMDFEEIRALFSACEKIEKEYDESCLEETKNDVL